MFGNKMFNNRSKVLKSNTKLDVNWETIFTTIYFLISVFGLIYQGRIIYIQFMSGKTIVSIEIGRLYNETLPAITVCLPELFSMERSAQNIPDFTEINRLYQNLLKNKSEKAKEFYRESFKKLIGEKLRNDSLDINEIFDKMSIKFKAINGDHNFILELLGKAETEKGDFTTKNNHVYKYVGDPLESIIIQNLWEGSVPNKCFTFFGSAQEQWKNFQAQLIGLALTINEKAMSNSLPISHYLFYLVSIHSPNHLPDLDDKQELKPVYLNYHTSVKYSEIRIQRLGEGYDTNCHSYESDSNYSYRRMRSDCVMDCYQDKLRDICKFQSGYFMSQSTLKQSYFNNSHDKIRSCFDKDYQSFIRLIQTTRLDCEKVCKVECNFKYYPLETLKIKGENTILNIVHGQLPDIFIKYIPEITLMGFICNFGGLLGMWLGLSLFTLFNKISNLFLKVVQAKNITYKFNIKVDRKRRGNLVIWP